MSATTNKRVQRIIVSSEYVPAAQRTDDKDWLFGDTVYVKLDCGHTVHGNPTMTYKPGSSCMCRECGAI